jgi:hypothetical protein
MEQETVAKGETHRENTEFVLLKSSTAKGCPQTPSYQHQLILRVYDKCALNTDSNPCKYPKDKCDIKKTEE